jgi:hypothetical protein
MALLLKQNLPIFSLLSDLFNKKVVGGKMNSGESHGNLLGKEAVRILNDSLSLPDLNGKNKDLNNGYLVILP